MPEYRPIEEDFSFRLVLESLEPLEITLIVLFPSLLIISVTHLILKQKSKKDWGVLEGISSIVLFISIFASIGFLTESLGTAQSDVNSKIAKGNIIEKYGSSKLMLGEISYKTDKTLWIQDGSYVNEETGKAHDIEFRFISSGEPVLSLVNADEKPISNDEYKSMMDKIKVTK